MEPRTRQERQSQEKKAMMLNKALELFSVYGFEQTTVRQICAASGMTTGSFYNFFGDKLGLIRELYVRLLRDSEPFLEPTPEHLQTPFQTICDYIVSSTSLFTSFPPSVSRQIYEESSRLMTRQYDVPYEQTSLGRMITFLEAAKKAGTADPGMDTENISIYLMGVSMGTTYYWLYRMNSMSYQTAAELILIPAFRAITDEPVIYKSETAVKK